MITRSFLLTILLLVFSFSSKAAIETFSNRKAGSTELVVSSTIPLLTVYDARYNEMLTNSGWSSNYNIANVNNVVRLGLNPQVVQTNDLAGTVTVNIKMWKWVSGSFTMSSTTQTLSLSYDHTIMTTVIDDIQSYSFTGAHRVEVYLTAVSGATLDLNDIFISSEMEVDRRYTLASGAVTGLNVDTTNSEFYVFNWDQKIGAEYYELEWVHISDSKMVSGTFAASSALKYDYYLNATRVLVKGNTYKISNIFDHGYIVYRIRPIGFYGTTDVRQEGFWTSPESGTVSSHFSGNVITVSSNFAGQINWEHQVSYDDKGQRFEGIAYSDGLGRGRQQMGLNTVTDQVMVSNVYYDELGRGVISDLPSPKNTESLRFDDNFNVFQTDNLPPGISPNDFNAASSTSCNVVTAPFANTGGSGAYYSTANTTQDGANVRVPDAGGFPYSRIYYMNDFTMRPEKVAAMGSELKGGNGHDTKIYYPTPNQNELDKLFGAEVGQASHYQKMVTVDANGQIYIQYSDMAGRVVATYLAGASPSSLTAIDGNNVTTETTHLLPQNDQTIDVSVPSSTLTYNQYVTNTGNYTFNYAFTPAQFKNNCMPEGFCMDCVYEFQLKIIEECSGVEKHNSTVILSGEDVGNVCAVDATEVYNSPAISLAQGSYIFIKTLKLHEEIIEDSWCDYIDNSTCLTPLSELFNPEYLTEEFLNCDDEGGDLENNEDPCSAYREAMLNDMTPGGQYAQFVNTAGVFTPLINTSTTHSVLTEDDLGTDEDWKHPRLSDDSGYGHYKEEDGVTDVIINGLYPEQLTFQEFVEYFQPSWANALLPYHPEYCFLKECEENALSNEYDNDMMNTYTFDEACDAGYFIPFSGCTITPIPCSTAGSDPYFVANPTAIPGMSGLLNNYFSSGQSIWEQAIYQVFADEDETVEYCMDRFDELSETEQACYLDMIWVTYRAMYLELKAKFIREETNRICSNSNIGKGDWAGFVPVWGNLDQLIAIDPTLTPGITGSQAETLLDNLMEENCETVCEEYASDWIASLSGCEQYHTLSNTDKINIHDDLVDLCMSGCDADHPQGSTTAPSGSSGYQTIDEILAHYFGSGYEDELCTSLLISEPGPYQSTDELTGVVSKPLDVCACDAIEQANWDFVNSNPNELYLEQILAQNTGVSLEDANLLLCTCNSFLDGTYDPETEDNWITDANIAMEATGIEIPASLACATNCVDCQAVGLLIDELTDRFEEVEDFEESTYYDDILTNYLNNELGFHLTYADYESYIGKCGASSGIPYCELNPLMNEWAEIMTLLAFRGDLTNTELAQVDLLEDNIVYANGELQNTLSGDNYWAEVSGGELIAHFGSNEQTCGITLTLPADPDFGFEDIVRFGNIQPSSKSCDGNSTFIVAVDYLKCGKLQTSFLTGYSNCMAVNLCYCAPTKELLCDELPSSFADVCYQPRLDEMYQNALDLYMNQVTEAHNAYVTEFKSDCAAAFSTETLSYSSPQNNYHYTLFFYDQAGNLARTVSPKGVMTGFNTANVDVARNSVASFSSYTAVSAFSPSPFPTNTYETKYKYNSYDQLVSTTNPDQVGATNYWYDRYGRIVLSQNPIQADDLKYSYILYDKFGRPVETGQMDREVSPGVFVLLLSESVLKADDLGVSFKNWIYSGIRTEVTYTVYDEYMSSAVNTSFKSGQQNLRMRVASVVYFDAVSAGSMPATGYVSATHYSYDIHGNVLEQLQDVPALQPVRQNIKSTRYEFELLSGNVKKVHYQKEEYNTSNSAWEPGRDRITHEYLYDGMNRLTEVLTTTDGGVHKNREAHYSYFDYGALAREEIGEHKVQANDFTYTINGWIKGMNSVTLNSTRDPGLDGAGGNNAYFANNVMAHDGIARDIVGYTLGYFQGDYSGIETATFEADPYNGVNAMEAQIKPLYNGNIAHNVTAIAGMTNVTQAGVYQYDQLNRLKSMKVFTDANIATTNHWGAAAYTDKYFSSYAYDRNGNLTSLVRNGDQNLATYGYAMDNFTYNYTNGTNRLREVTDAASAATVNTAYPTDINSGQAVNNYAYDKLGQLLADAQEGMVLTWRIGDKKLKSQRNASKQVEYIYNPLGQRVLKIEKNVTGGNPVEQSAGYSWIYTYYAYDANGQVMATYNVTMNSAASTQLAKVDEQMLYGAGRLGMIQEDRQVYNNGYVALIGPKFTNKVGKKNYELTNYLGNVNAVITDRKKVTQNTQLNTVNTFATGIESWTTGSGGSIAYDSPNQQLVVTATSSSSYIQKGFSTVIGEDYVVAISATSVTTPSVSGLIIGSGTLANVVLTSGGTTAIRFTANSTTSYVRIKPTSGSGIMVFRVQDVSIKTRAKYDAVAVLRTDYYPFGMAMTGDRSSNNGNYRYGYNGMEMDNEVKGNGNSYTTEFRQYDPRLGRWMSLDPLMASFPWQSPYVAFDNNPVLFTDPMGLAAEGGPGKEVVSCGERTTDNNSVWRAKYVRSLENVEDGYQVIFEYDDDGFTHTYTYTYSQGDGSAGSTGQWNSNQVSVNTADDEHKIDYQQPDQAITSVLKGSEENFANREISKVEPIESAETIQTNNNPTNQAGQVLEIPATSTDNKTEINPKTTPTPTKLTDAQKKALDKSLTGGGLFIADAHDNKSYWRVNTSKTANFGTTIASISRQFNSQQKANTIVKFTVITPEFNYNNTCIGCNSALDLAKKLRAEMISEFVKAGYSRTNIIGFAITDPSVGTIVTRYTIE